MVQVQHSPLRSPSRAHCDHITIPKEVLLSCAALQARREEIEQWTCELIQDTIVGDASRIEATLAQIAPTKKIELELMAQVIVSKALEEPQHSQACVSLSGALQILLPALPSSLQGKKGETFMHALLDVFQTEFEAVFPEPGQDIASNKQEQTQPETEATLVEERKQHRIRAIVHLAGHLHCQGLLGNGVVSQMVQDLVEMGQAEAANELLWFVGVVAHNADQEHQQHLGLGTVLEDAGESDAETTTSGKKERRQISP